MKLLMEGWRKFLKEDMTVDEIEEALIADGAYDDGSPFGGRF